MIAILPAVSKSDFKTISQLAQIIWKEHYYPITGKAHINYMLEKFQSVQAIEDQINTGMAYFILMYKCTPVGYTAFKLEKNDLFLSKLYVLKSYRGKQIGKTAMGFVEKKAKASKLKVIRLTVNVNNTNSIRAYKKMGFKNQGALLTDIGEGFVMDDHEMVKVLF
ncbi:MAG: GNAT family N-acetyltransferase [Aestuariibaculum sp.]